MEKYKVLFVCLGNICRSPAAEGIMNHIISKHNDTGNWHTDSAGTYAGHKGELPDRRMRTAAISRGYDLTHRSRPVTMGDFLEFDLIVAMDDDNYYNLRTMAPDCESEAKVVRMSRYFDKGRTETYVPDPYYSGSEGFELVLDLLEEACENLYHKIKKEK